MRPPTPPQLKPWPRYSSYSTPVKMLGHRLSLLSPNNFATLFLHASIHAAKPQEMTSGLRSIKHDYIDYLITRQLQEISKSVLCPLRCWDVCLPNCLSGFRFPLMTHDFVRLASHRSLSAGSKACWSWRVTGSDTSACLQRGPTLEIYGEFQLQSSTRGK